MSENIEHCSTCGESLRSAGVRIAQQNAEIERLRTALGQANDALGYIYGVNDRPNPPGSLFNKYAMDEYDSLRAKLLELSKEKLNG